jgi:tripartite ATP-independent transporter DctP family solute receptor
MDRKLTRRALVGGAVLGSLSMFVKSIRAAEFTFTQYHNQPANSPLHQRLVGLWAAVAKETGGRVETTVYPSNNKIAGSDPAALKLLVSGEIQFFTLMGGILGNVVPVAEVQQVPFAFRNAAHAHETMDGPLGAYLREEMRARGIHGFPVGAFDNGIRQIACSKRAIVRPADLKGIRMRIPAGQMFSDTFAALGAEPVVVNSDTIRAALADGRVDAQENPLAYVELLKIYEVVKYISMTSHMWSGFNMLAHLPTWTKLPGEIQASIERNVAQYVRLQRQDQEALNSKSRGTLEGFGLAFNEVEAAPFRRELSGVYATWKEKLGTRCWSLLENAAGRLA